ncbi:C-Jun-amino-terminal kinase-interacting protein 2 isoform X2 [Corythoichthys intestinalis]|uniref:C-Jun-amino-terminal kinase-interacting protein 2 isoform X2 n=1 Tax=Corythoichthys intestinalis TaxID=161448 RepID=UPI0025A68765|nr:C-Jun-amino-terminal kinase-interacting protein 2 isoform X2 [Corythoichthys intestinalis]
MADRAEMFSLNTFHSLSPPGCRPAHDISLEEFDDEDLSEITDDCGIGLNYDSDPYEKDSLILEKNDTHHPVCSFQDDFQEFEMIDDEDEDDEDEEDEDEEEVDPDAPPSPSASPPPSPILGTLKSRPTTLNLTTAVSQDSLNNNSSLSPKKGTWQDSLRNPSSQGRTTPTHSCLDDGSHVTGQCPTSPLSQPLMSQNEGSFGQLKSHPGDVIKPKPDTSRVPSVDEHSQCSDTEVDHDLNNSHNHKHLKRLATDTYTITNESGTEAGNDPDPDGTSRCLSSTAPLGGNDGADTPLSDDELDKDFEVEFMRKETYDMVCKENPSSYVEFPCIEPYDPAPFSSDAPDKSKSSDSPASAAQAVAAQESHSPSSDPGIADMNQQGYVTSDLDRELSSPGSDSELDGEVDIAFTCEGATHSNMISSISETELDLTSDDSSSGRSSHLTNSIEEASSPTSDQELDPDTELEQDSGIVGLKASLFLGQPDPIKEASPPPSPSPLPSPTIATPSSADSPKSYGISQALADLQDSDLPGEHQADPDETLPPQQCEDSTSRQMVLKIEPDHSLECFKPSFYLPVGPRLMPVADDYDETSEGDSESESEDELSENSDSPWLLSNLVNRMISEGSYPISCPEDCFKREVSVSDTISPSSEMGDGDSFADEDPELVTTSGPRNIKADQGDRTKMCGSPYGSVVHSRDTMEHCVKNSTETVNYSSAGVSTTGLSKNAKRLERNQDPDKDLDSPNLSDKDIGRETDPRTTSRSSASLERITEVKHSLTLDIPTSQTNRCFSLTYSTDNDEEDDQGDSYPFLDDFRRQSYRGSDLQLETSESCVPDQPCPDRNLPPCEKAPSPKQPSEDDGLAYDSMKYTLVVDENTTLELVSLRRCTSVLSEDSELSTLCDEEPLETGQVDYCCNDEGVRPELLSSSEDSSPEADLPFSKKFLNVFVNSTSRSSSTESFGLFSCTVNGEERDQTHRAVYRFIPRHADELELDVDDPLYVEEEEDDYWYRGYNMRTGERGIFPAFYAHEVIGHSKELLAMKRNPAWIETFDVQFLGSVEVPQHQGNGILCAAMQKIALSRKRTVHVRPPSLCELEISLQGVKLIMSLEDEYDCLDEFDRCSHFFQMKNISFCGCHPRNNCYFGFITKHPMLSRFACHVFVSQESMRPVAECVGRAFQEYYQEHVEYACPTEDIYLE